MAEPQTIRDLIRAKTITGDEGDAVVLGGPSASLCRFASGHGIDPVAAVKRRERAKAIVANPEAIEHLKRAVGTAILLARVETV